MECFDPKPLIEYAITERDLTNIYQYLQAMQAHFDMATWDDTVSTAIWRKISERVRKNQLTLETYHEAMSEYQHNYRLLPEIHAIERETAAEIRQYLRDTYVYGPMLATATA